MEIPGGASLPIVIVKESYKEYIPEKAQIDIFEAEEIQRNYLSAKLSSAVSDGKILKKDFNAEVINGLLNVVLTGECEEQIAETVEME